MNKNPYNQSIYNNNTQYHDTNRSQNQEKSYRSSYDSRRNNEVVISQLEELRKSCKDDNTLASIDKTLNYVRQYHDNNNQQIADNKNSHLVNHNHNQISQYEGNKVAFNRDWDIFDDLRQRMDMVTRSIEDSIFHDTSRHNTFRSMIDDIRRDMEHFDTNFGLDIGGRNFREHFNFFRNHQKDLLEKYKIDEKEPEGAVGVVKEVETHTVNGKTNARVRCEYTLDDGSKIAKEKEFIDEKPKMIKE